MLLIIIMVYCLIIFILIDKLQSNKVYVSVEYHDRMQELLFRKKFKLI